MAGFAGALPEAGLPPRAGRTGVTSGRISQIGQDKGAGPDAVARFAAALGAAGDERPDPPTRIEA